MPTLSSPRLQTALVVLLSAASLATLLFNSLSPFLLPGLQAEAQQRLREASGRMAEAAAGVLGEGGALPTTADQRLRKSAEEVLAEYQDVEGGFYIGPEDRFTGYAHPGAEPKLDPKGKAKPPPPRTDPPPLERTLIRAQAQQSLELSPGDALATTRDVRLSRVVVVTQPVGAARPAVLATWVMFRLTGPEQLQARAYRYALSTGLALAGIALSLLLTWNLTRTVRRQRREEERLRDELRRAEHLAGLGKLLAGVAHEVRNPLAAIRSTAQMWQRLPDTSRTPASIDAVVGAVDSLDALVRRLLYFARADQADRAPLDLAALLHETLDLVRAQAAEQGVSIEEDLAADLPRVEGSANGLRQVLLNLLTNALQALPRGGRLRCSAGLRLPERLVEVRVADSGPGIPPEVRAHLFEPFFTTRPDGTGLGLALCREIVENHGGKIELEASGPSGTVFQVRLPADASAHPGRHA